MQAWRLVELLVLLVFTGFASVRTCSYAGCLASVYSLWFFESRLCRLCSFEWNGLLVFLTAGLDLLFGGFDAGLDLLFV